MMNNSFQSNITRKLMHDRCPATICLMLATTILFVAMSLELVGRNIDWIIFHSNNWYYHPWTLVTGSLLSPDPLTLIFNVIWMWFVGGSLERSYGTRTFLGLWAAISAVTGLALWIGFLVTGHFMGVGLSASLLFSLILDALTVIWGILNRDMVVLLFGMLPLRAITVAWISVVFTLCLYGLPLGIFALAGCGFAWAFVEYRAHRRRYSGVIRVDRRKGNARSEDGPFQKFQAWRSARRFEKLMRNSGVDRGDGPRIH